MVCCVKKEPKVEWWQAAKYIRDKDNANQTEAVTFQSYLPETESVRESGKAGTLTMCGSLHNLKEPLKRTRTAELSDGVPLCISISLGMCVCVCVCAIAIVRVTH